MRPNDALSDYDAAELTYLCDWLRAMGDSPSWCRPEFTEAEQIAAELEKIDTPWATSLAEFFDHLALQRNRGDERNCRNMATIIDTLRHMAEANNANTSTA